MKIWIEIDYDFFLKKDYDLSHKPEKSNIVQIKKELNSLEFYFNYHLLLDLAFIKNF